MAYHKVRIEVWCDWNPAESDLEEIAENISAGDAICTRREVVAVVDRPQDIEDEEAMSFFGGAEGDATKVRGRSVSGQPAGLRSLDPRAIFAGHMTVGVDRRKRAASRRPVRNAC